MASQEKLKKAEEKKNKLEYKRNVENFTEKIKQPIRDKIFEAIGSDKQQVSEEEYRLAPQKSKYDLVRELKRIPIFNEFINQGGTSPEEFLKYIEKNESKAEEEHRKMLEVYAAKKADEERKN